MARPDESTGSAVDDGAPGPPRRIDRRGLLRGTGLAVGAAAVAATVAEPAWAGELRPPEDGGADRADVAVPDLSGGDPTGAIKRAIASVESAGGGVVYLEAGEHEITADLVVPGLVSLRGMSMTGTRLLMAGNTVVHPADVEGAGVENLTIEGAGQGLRYDGPASYCVARRLRLVDCDGEGIALRGTRYERLFLEDLYIDRCGSHGIDLDPVDGSTSVFMSGLSIGTVGSGEGGAADAMRLAGRCHLSQVQIGPVRTGGVGVRFRPGSDFTTLTGYYLRLEGGIAFDGHDDREGIALGAGSVEDVGL